MVKGGDYPAPVSQAFARGLHDRLVGNRIFALHAFVNLIAGVRGEVKGVLLVASHQRHGVTAGGYRLGFQRFQVADIKAAHLGRHHRAKVLLQGQAVDHHQEALCSRINVQLAPVGLLAELDECTRAEGFDLYSLAMRLAHPAIRHGHPDLRRRPEAQNIPVPAGRDSGDFIAALRIRDQHSARPATHIDDLRAVQQPDPDQRRTLRACADWRSGYAAVAGRRDRDKDQ